MDRSAEENAAEIKAFVHSFLHEKYRTNFSDKFEILLVEHTRGNALFLAELLKNMEEKRQIVCTAQADGAAQWRLAGTVADIAVLPKKIEAVLRERVERLDKNLHDILVCASVQGDEFFAQAVAKAQQADCGRLIDLLDEQLAQEHQLIIDHGGKYLPNGARVHAFSFRHNLLREYVYGKISKTKKEHIHAKMGAALEEICQPEQDKIAGVLAGHFPAGHVLPKAVSYALKAAQSANERYGSAEAVRCARMGMEALEEWRQVLSEQDDTEHKVRLLLELAKAEEYGGDPQEEKNHIQAGIMLLEENLALVEQTAEELQADFYAELGRLYDRKGGKPQETKKWLDKSLVLYEHLGKKSHAAELYNFLGDVCNFIPSSGEDTPIEQSISMLKKGFSLAREIQNFSLQSRILSRLTWKTGNRDFSAAEKYSQEALKLSRISQDTLSEIRALVAMAYIYRRYAKQKKSTTYLENAANLSRRVGNVVSLSEILNDIGFDSSSYMSCKDNAKYFLKQSIAIKDRLGSKKIASLTNLGWIFAEQGEWNEAENCWLEAIAQASERSQSGYGHNIGILYALQERYKEAEAKFIGRISTT
ncbi:MAG: tetratricopeptide repeat protein [Candidatus Electronema sp. V4]|uniref:tetratricopeptide repeat protein n=1 Tax=Candidatus Electronema sp. V4 TaxID=3454756 RepID=UPI004055583B